MQVGRYRFSPRWRYTLLYLLVGGVMLALGNWQLRRADEKITLQRIADTALASAPVALSEILTDLSDGNVRRVYLNGRFEPVHQFLWDNRVHLGQVGFEVITPFRLTTGSLVLVNRGWVPLGLSRAQLPDVNLPEIKVSELVGLFTRPSIGFSTGDAVASVETQWPRILQHFAFDELSQVLGETILPGLVQLDHSAAAQTGLTLFKDNWSPVANGPERHYGYAFQWFAMFAALTVIYLLLNIRKVLDKESE